MNNTLKSNWLRFSGILLGLLLTAGAATSVQAQGDIPSGTVSGSGSGPTYSYSLSFSDAAAATAPIGSIWYAWVPGAFFLPGNPTAITTPAGWTSADVNNSSIQFTASSPANDIAAGSTLTGFGYQATFSPAQLAAAPNSGESVAYVGGIESDAGKTFTAQAASPVPEPSTWALFALGTIVLGLAGRRKLRTA